MKEFSRFIIAIFACVSTNVACAAVTVKKAPTVATTTQAPAASAASLVPTVVQLVQTVSQLNKAQKELTAECIPSAQERAFVDNTMKEWAKTGAATADEVMKSIGRGIQCCNKETMNKDYATSVKNAMDADMAEWICYDCFTDATDQNAIWYKYPKVGFVSYCKDGMNSCKNPQTKSNIYEIFNVIDFTTADYTAQESAMAAKLIAKIENCSYAKLSAKKRAMWGEFLVGTIGNIGKPTNTTSIMESVGGIVNGGGLSSIGGIATKLLDR